MIGGIAVSSVFVWIVVRRKDIHSILWGSTWLSAANL